MKLNDKYNKLYKTAIEFMVNSGNYKETIDDFYIQKMCWFYQLAEEQFELYEQTRNPKVLTDSIKLERLANDSMKNSSLTPLMRQKLKIVAEDPDFFSRIDAFEIQTS